ncbi:MAG: nucleotidyltransferase domain-containing protein [Cyclobacteriaceae bacterium]|nr:nucleotidyltransferase domain-containing protein [Cyclobacteriaceae bacterium]
MLLRDKDRIRLIEIFNTIDFPIEIWAYGSRVTGDAFEGSDLDLVIRSSNLQRLPAYFFLDLKEKIQKSNVHILEVNAKF